MKIAFTGPQGTGKTTLVQELGKLEQFKDYQLFTGLTRRLADRGISFNTSGTDETQLALIDIHNENLQCDNFLSERCIIDCYVYGLYQFRHGRISIETMERLEEALQEMVSQYDYIFYLKLEFKPVEDGVRDLDKDFLSDISSLFEEIITTLKLQGNNIHQLTGSVQQRIQMMEDLIRC